MIKYIKNWFNKLFGIHNVVSFRKILAKNNWNGIPKLNLTCDEVVKGTETICPIIPMTLEIYPDWCPKCQEKLKTYQSDYTKFDDGGGQFNVYGKYCPKGHWTHLESA